MLYRYGSGLFASTVLSSCQSVLSTEAMLSALTVMQGDQTWNYVGKDVLGQLGSLFVMMGLSKTVDRNPHRFIALSHGMQQASMALMLLSPMLPHYFLPLAGVANMCSGISFMGFGAVNAKCIQKLSFVENNVGELYTKLTIQQTLASTVGLTAGMFLAKHGFSSHELFVVLGVGRVASHYWAVSKLL